MYQFYSISNATSVFSKPRNLLQFLVNKLNQSLNIDCLNGFWIKLSINRTVNSFVANSN